MNKRVTHQLIGSESGDSATLDEEEEEEEEEEEAAAAAEEGLFRATAMNEVGRRKGRAMAGDFCFCSFLFVANGGGFFG